MPDLVSANAEPGVDASLIRELLDWIEGNAPTIESNVLYAVDPLRRKPPDIVFAEPGDPIELGGELLVVDPMMGGVWDADERLIVLVQPWHSSEPVDRSILLHELVHAVQSANGASVCDADAEWEAYAMQTQWLAERDIIMFVDWEEVARYAHCPLESAP